MGIIASTMRLMTLTNTKNYLEYKLASNTEKMGVLTAKVTENEEFYGSLDPESPEMSQYRIRKAELNEMEKKLDAEQKMLQTRLQQVATEMEACQRLLYEGIQRSGMFTYGMGR
ncbi:MAG: hypothetical protein K6E29_00980 [Cyanobacteria bacterium RUI128]|nr:hypothetical protein [Cyanobacteria bacterium RUI128]